MSSPNRVVIAQGDHDAQATAATTETFSVGECQFDATVAEVSIIPSGALATDGTNNRTFTLQNKKQDGTGTTVIATYTNNPAGGALVAADEKLMTLTATTADLNVSAGDVLAIVETVGGTGSAHPNMEFTVTGARR